MKIILIALTVLGVCGCNTMIGMGRDTKEGYHWTKGKINEARQGNGSGGSGGSGGSDGGYGEAPIY